MYRSFRSLCLCIALATSVLTGCSSQPPPALTPATAESQTGEALPDGLAKLSDADRDAALKQIICPVSGEKLGSMGPPPKVMVDGKEVFICCSGCEEALKKDPATHLAKLKNAPPPATEAAK